MCSVVTKLIGGFSVKPLVTSKLLNSHLTEPLERTFCGTDKGDTFGLFVAINTPTHCSSVLLNLRDFI